MSCCNFEHILLSLEVCTTCGSCWGFNKFTVCHRWFKSQFYEEIFLLVPIPHGELVNTFVFNQPEDVM